MSLRRRTLLARLLPAGGVLAAGCLNAGRSTTPGSLSVEWVGGDAATYDGNHHGMAAADVDGRPVLGVPRNDFDEEGCDVVAIDDSGQVLWDVPLAMGDCNPHAIGHVGVGAPNGDDRPAFLVAMEAGDVIAYDAATGQETFRATDLLESIGFSAPVATDLSGDGTPELAVTDFAGNLSIVRPDGSIVWTAALESPVHLTPIAADLTTDGDPNLAVNSGRLPGEVICFDGDGEVAWRAERDDAALSWSLVERRDTSAIALTDRDRVALLDGRTGESLWSTALDRDARVGPGDGNSVFATARDGVVRALDLGDGTVRWETKLSEERVRMVSPAVGAVSGGSTTNVVATTYDGTVAVLDATAGELLASRELDVGLFTPPVLVDVTEDGRDDVLLLYGDARVGALTYREETG